MSEKKQKFDDKKQAPEKAPKHSEKDLDQLTDTDLEHVAGGELVI